VYFTDRVIGRTADYTLRIPLDQLIRNTLTIRYVGREETPTVNWDVGAYDFVWDGNDASGTPHLGSATVTVTIGGIDDPGLMRCEILWDGSTQCEFSSPSMVLDVLPIIYSQVVGGYKAIVAGLGGWTLSAHHFYDATKGMLYFGDGSSRQVTAQLVNNDTRYRAASDDGAEVYLFDRHGLHLHTLHGLTGAVLYRFTYDTQHRLLAITDAYGNATRILRDGSGTLTGIQTPFGQVTQLTLGADGYLASIANPRGDTHTMTYYAGGLLRTFTQPRGQVSTFTYDRHGLLLRDANSAGNAVRFVTESQDPTTGARSVQMATALGRTTHLALEQTATGMRRTETDPQGMVRTFSTDYNRQMTSSWADTTIQESYSPDVRLGDLPISLPPATSARPPVFSRNRPRRP
jgi:YD repeat-containing protein